MSSRRSKSHYLKLHFLFLWVLYAGGKLLLELNRVLRPGGFFVWSATPIYQKLRDDVQIWNGIAFIHEYYS